MLPYDEDQALTLAAAHERIATAVASFMHGVVHNSGPLDSGMSAARDATLSIMSEYVQRRSEAAEAEFVRWVQVRMI